MEKFIADNLLITLIILVGCVLNIILFWKIWVMTDNVAIIKRKYAQTYLKRFEMYKVINNPFYSNDDKRKILYDNMFCELYEVHSNKEMPNRYNEFKEITTFYTKQFNKVGVDTTTLIPTSLEDFMKIIG